MKVTAQYAQSTSPTSSPPSTPAKRWRSRAPANLRSAHINVLNLLEGVLGSRKWMAARLGARGGKSRSTGKAAAARANGALGGRPRKLATR